MSLLKLIKLRLFFRRCAFTTSKSEAIDWEYYSDPSNFVSIANNIIVRAVSCDMKKVLDSLHELKDAKNDAVKEKNLKDHLTPMLLWLPNTIHPRVLENKSGEPVMLEKVGTKSSFTYFPSSFNNLTKRLNVLRTRYLGHMTGNKSYYLKNDLAVLENSLVRFGITKLMSKGFQLVSVPDILPKECIENCGLKTENKHSQVYHIDGDWAPDLCLSGTSEMALASYLAGKTFRATDLPLRFCATSRCYRAEAKKHQKEIGIFRVHQFTKVEMFGITANENSQESEQLLEEFTSIQKEIFSELGLHFKILEMQACDLGLPAYHKIDMEAWIPTQKIFGEISSASNCTDYQSRRMNIKYLSSDGQTKFCHTVNGTACAIPRLLIAIFENFQNLDGSVNIPKPLQNYMKKDIISGKFKEVMLSLKPVG